MYYGFDRTFLILLPALLISLWAQLKVKSAYAKNSKIRSIRGYTGAQAARELLNAEGLYDVPVEIIPGNLTDHYDPAHRIMRLSAEVFNGTSVAALGIAAHETGHAIQHKVGYSALQIRNAIFPIVNFSSNASWFLFLIGMFFSLPFLIDIGIFLFCAVVIFQVITLPVEFNASHRAIKILQSSGILLSEEIGAARSVLSAAALTYIAAALMSIAQLLRLILLSNRNRD